ncbi:transmembrane protein, putative (macronuclear) [Tetrahymena thermophila SB210]|uniref:Transmembrane protein, putative n=1 Tax=Tetrahymena thermophila (strain SB210) TaxID=312017 RepID=I7MKG4_TETTS|nr:transmembrane protein, putative [Tetrahymena thermophila SB210]EAR98381.2 transmembrane protein, putative [Tetrahymena thermophila SB210]|eukprot:XP_001018626.2 transmembrane protein, putative [Tetrahymena thermophila SB210]
MLTKKLTRQKTNKASKSAQRNSDQLSKNDQGHSETNTKKISKQTIFFIILQIISLGEYACIIMSIHVFLYNDYLVQFGLQLSFFLVSKIIKIAYYTVKKQYIQVVLIVLCLDYVAAYLIIKEERQNNQRIEQGDKVVREEWVQMKQQQQKKIDQYLSNMSYQKSPTNSKQKNDEMKQMPLNVKKVPENIKMSPHQNTFLSQFNQKPTISTQVNNTETTQKEQFQNSLQNKQLFKLGTGLTEGRSPNQDIQFFNANPISTNTAQQNLQTDERSIENILPKISNQHESPNLNYQQSGQFMSRIEEYRNSQTLKSNLQLSIKQVSQESNSKIAFQSDYQRKQSNFSQQNRLKSQSKYSVQKETSEEEKPAKKKNERVLEYQIQSSVLKKLKLNKSQLQSFIFNKFTTIYIEEEADQKNEKYFMRRKFLLSVTKIFDGIFMDAPCLYILAYIIANHLDLAQLYPLLQAGYWYISISMSISICLFNNLQNLPFRQHDNYFFLQLKSFIKNLAIVLCMVVSTTVLWAFTSLNGTALLIYDISVFCIINHQVFSFMQTVYKEEVRGDSKFKFMLFLICVCFSILVGSLLLFANLILLLNSDLAHEALLQLRKQLESPDPKLVKDSLFELVERGKYGFRFLQRQNLFFVLNLTCLAILSLFVNQLYNFSWDSSIVSYHKLLLGFLPVCLLGILLQYQDSSFFNDTLGKIVFDHYNRVVNNVKMFRVKLRVKQLNEQQIYSQFSEVESKLKNLKEKYSQQDQFRKDFEHEEARLNRSVKSQQGSSNNKSQNNLKLITISRRIKEIKEQLKDIKQEIESLQVIFEVRDKELQVIREQVKQCQEEFDNYGKINGINLAEEVMMDEQQIENEAIQIQYQEYLAELQKNQFNYNQINVQEEIEAYQQNQNNSNHSYQHHKSQQKHVHHTQNHHSPHHNQSHGHGGLHHNHQHFQHHYAHQGHQNSRNHHQNQYIQNNHQQQHHLHQHYQSHHLNHNQQIQEQSNSHHQNNHNLRH